MKALWHVGESNSAHHIITCRSLQFTGFDMPLKNLPYPHGQGRKLLKSQN